MHRQSSLARPSFFGMPWLFTCVVLLTCSPSVLAEEESGAGKGERVSASKIAVERSGDDRLGINAIDGVQQASATVPIQLTPELKAEHPLGWALSFAAARSEYIRNHVDDYTCRLIKRERIDGQLQPMHVAEVAVRRPRVVMDEAKVPLSVYMRFESPRSVRDRRVIYVDGMNNGEASVRKGGSSLAYVVLSIDPNGRVARQQSNYPITDIGFDKIMDRLIELIELDMGNDPLGVNTEVTYFRDARVRDRSATHIQIIHPSKEGGFNFYRANAYVDDELHVPIRLEVYDWPKSDVEPPELMEEYTYTDLKLNVGLADAVFDEARLDAKSPGPVDLGL